MRIAMGGFAHETNTFSTLPTRESDFSEWAGADLIDTPFWRAVAEAGHTVYPLFEAHATPSGRVTQACFQAYLTRLLGELEACLPLDGLLLELHGAMEVEQIGDGETAILEAVRDLVGPDVFIAVTLDLHANLSQRVVALSDLVTAYRTAPHRDTRETQERGARLMLDCLEQGIRPVSTLIKLPLLVGGEAAVTEVEPARSLFARLPGIDALPGILVSSILVGCAWTDSPETSMSVVITGTDATQVREQAQQLAAKVWAQRVAFHIDVPTAPLEGALSMALAAEERPVFISDSGDNPTAGAAGDSPNVIHYLVESGMEDVLVAGIAAPEAVEQCFAAGEGAQISVVLGGVLDHTFAEPYPTEVTVVRLCPQIDRVPPRALVRIGRIDVVLQSNRRPFTELGHFRSLGLDPADWKVIVVKLGYLFPELRDYAPLHIMALTPGFGDQRIERLPFERLRRPIYPLDREMVWQVE